MNWTDEALEKALSKVEKNITKIGEHFPHVAYDGKFNDEGASFWTSGFWPGLLWLLYEEKKNESALVLARKLEEKLDEVMDGFVTLHHDVGFMWLPSAVIDYKITKNEMSRIRGLKAASHLAGRFNLKGHFIRAWNDALNPGSKGWAIIDCMMNIPLLFWASKEIDDPRFYQIAEAHADTVAECFIRPNHTSSHIFSFNPYTGERIGSLAGQGKAADSAWARGQAWAIYGFAIAYRETGKKEYQTVAKNVAEYFLAHLPEDKVPYWDFDSDEEDKYVRDSSATACTASGLLELSGLMEGPEKEYYREQAILLLKGLYENYFDFAEENQDMILKGTVNYPKRKHVNVPIIYGDYFFVEALIKLKHRTNIF